MDANYGGFNRCDVLIAVAGDDEIDVMFQFDGASATVETSGPARWCGTRRSGTSDECDIALTLADGPC